MRRGIVRWLISVWISAMLPSYVVAAAPPNPPAPAAPTSPVVGQPAPPFSLVLLHGERVELTQWRGRPVLLNFWAST